MFVIKPKKYRFLQNVTSIKAILLGYLSYALLGWIFLCLPFSQKIHVSMLDNLFIAISAVSTTGLVPISVSDSYTFLGELVILLLIQLGGIGYMTFGSFIILAGSSEGLSLERQEISKIVFNLPHGFKITQFIMRVMYFTILIELVGSIGLYIIFVRAGMSTPLWSAIFHCVSSFNTAGFSLYNNSFESFYSNVPLNLTIGTLSYCGAIGFIVFVDIWRRIKGEIRHVTLTTSIIVHTTFWMSVVGMILLYVSEPSIVRLPQGDRILAAFFQTMTAMTTVGFNTVPIGGLTKASLLLIIMLMVIGASPAGTGGGLKSTTFTAMLGVIKSILKGEQGARFWGRAIPYGRVIVASASFGLYTILLISGTYILSLTETANFESIFFEVASAMGTVGLSSGLTSSLTVLGKILITLLMFIGRLGPLTFGMAIISTNHDNSHTEDIAV